MMKCRNFLCNNHDTKRKMYNRIMRGFPLSSKFFDEREKYNKA